MEELAIVAQQPLRNQSVYHGRKRPGCKAECFEALLDRCRWEALMGVPTTIYRGAQKRVLCDLTAVEESFSRGIIYSRHSVCRC
ncbi:hypothetical protein [Microvirga aerophila]|uniref:Uncharacterized protein n=1 Tax=Microvirga aerophila TaxID=670291 RepID=A0A512C3R4_9HYPH|nr:hypothetical protein [Microvirga aerophila]GEO18850.1 hypothetical protein MAE02_65460 [Microvirga aerophila]